MTQPVPPDDPNDPASWPTGRAVWLEPLVRRVLAPNPSPYTFTGTQTYLVGAGADVAVIDPGPAEADHIDAILAAVGPARIVAIACTHTHRDHSPAARALQAKTGAPIIGCAALALDDDGPRADASFDHDYRPDRVLADGEALTGEGWTLTAVATPGHTSNHLCYALDPGGALFTGRPAWFRRPMATWAPIWPASPCCKSARTASITRRTAHRSRTRASLCAA